ncbi:MAG: SIS domain-containing protein [Chloroflexota bacterium]|nr:MAG: SIS domain-containing protein [Chloroflexota bacterium]
MYLIRSYVDELKNILDKLSQEQVEQVLAVLHEARMANQQVFIFGNGGSASTASHFVCDLGKNTRVQGVPNFRVIGLIDNIALFSALANDDGYENVFLNQLIDHVQPGDVVVAISTSGNSMNVVNAVQFARSVGARTISFTGFDSGQLGSLVDVDLHVSSHSIEHVEDVHLVLEHLITRGLRELAMQYVLQGSSITNLAEISVDDGEPSLD